MYATTKGYLGTKAPVFRKIEAELVGGLARIANRQALVEIELVLGYDLNGIKLNPGDIVMIRSNDSLGQWANQVYIQPDETQFVLCPEAYVVAYKSGPKGQVNG
jgi:hypothetical protein